MMLPLLIALSVMGFLYLILFQYARVSIKTKYTGVGWILIAFIMMTAAISPEVSRDQLLYELFRFGSYTAGAIGLLMLFLGMLVIPKMEARIQNEIAERIRKRMEPWEKDHDTPPQT